MSNSRHSRSKNSLKVVMFSAIASLLAANLACGLQTTENPTEISQTVGPLPTTVSLPGAAPVLLPPGLVECSPHQNDELGINEPITLYFNQPMERQSVEASASGSTDQDLTFNWLDDSTVEILLDERLAPGADFSLALDTSARSSMGIALPQPISLYYRAVDSLKLAQYLPEDGSRDVDPTSAVVASFNRPIIPLGAEPESQPQGFSIYPEALGQGTWLNTSTFVFYPETALAGGVDYSIQINPDLISTDGAPLNDGFSWSFTTAVPQLDRVEPNTEFPWPLDPEITMTFNQPMDRASVETQFSFAYPDGQQVVGEFEWAEDSRKMVFTPKDLLARNTVFNLNLGEQVSGEGGSPIASAFSAQVVTVPEFMVINSNPLPGGNVDGQNGLMLKFSSPLPADLDLLRYIDMVPAVSDLRTSVDQETLRVFGGFEANTDYVLTIHSSLSDIWGGALLEEYPLSFRTNPLNPDITLMTGTDAIFLTSQDSSMVVQAVNINDLPLRIGEVPLQDLFQLLGPNGYELRQNYQGLNQKSFTQQLNLTPDRRQSAEVFLSPEKQPLSPGIYYLRWDFPLAAGSAFERIYPGPYMIVVSDIQLTFKLSATDALIWAVDLNSGNPAENAQITLYSEGGQQIASGRTDAQGIFYTTIEPRSDPYSPVYAVLGEPASELFGMAFSNWSSGIEPWDFDIPVDQRPPGLYLYLYSDRPIYRPGDTVYFRAVVKNKSNGRYSPAEVSSIPLSVYGAEGQELMNLDLPLSAFGSAHGQIQLPDEAQPGYYSITSPVAENIYFGFQVAHYRKPEINLNIDFSQEEIRAGEPLNALLDASYYFGAPAGNLKLNWALYSAERPFSLTEYKVGPEDTSWMEPYRMPDFSYGLGKLISEGNGQTDQLGKFSLRVSSPLADTRQSLTLEITLQDESGLPVSARESILVNPDTVYIGLRPDTWIGKAGELIGFDVKTADWNADPLGNYELRAEFSKVVFIKRDPPPSDPFFSPNYTMQSTLIGSTDFSTGSEGLARLAFTPPESGTYLLDVVNLGSSNGARSQLLIWIGGDEHVVWPSPPNSRIQLAADKQAYRVGETAEIFIPNPFEGPVTALLTLERSVVMDFETLVVEPGGSTVNLPISEETAPNLIVSVTLLGHGENGTPDFRQGFVNILAEPTANVLNVSLLSEPQRAGPGDEITFDLLISDAGGQPVQGEFSLAVVDKAALALADPNSDDIVTAFYGEQPIGVRTSLSLVAYHRRIFNIAPGIGGGGGDSAPDVVREHFPDTAFWNADIATDKDGKAAVKMMLPDSLTTWQVEVRGLTQDTLVGQARTEIISTKDLLIRPAAPRFFVAQDYAQISAVVQNNSPLDMDVLVSLQTSGFSLDESSSAEKMISIPAGGRERLEWWGTVEDAESVELVFIANGEDTSGGNYHDAARPGAGVLPVLKYTAPQSTRTAGILDAGGKTVELISLPRSYSPSGGELEVELSPSLAAAMLGALDKIESTPYQSSEQILSSFLPNLETHRTLQEFGIQDASLATNLDQELKNNLLRLIARQNYDGGWAWWDGGLSDPYITAYVLFGLQRARMAGSFVNQNTIDQGISFLQQSVPHDPQLNEGTAVQSESINWPERTWQWDRQAFQQFTLAQYNASEPLMIDAIVQKRDQLSPWAQALLALTLDAVEPDSQTAKDLLAHIQGAAVRSASGANWEFAQDEEGRLAEGYNMQSSLANTAIVLYALAQHDPGSPLVADSVRFLMANRSAGGSWASTYAASWTLMALNQVLIGTAELHGNFQYKAALNGNQIIEGTASGAAQLSSVNAQVPIGDLYPDFPNALEIEREDGLGRLYYTAGLSVLRPVADVAPLSNGLSIVREVFPFGSDCLDEACEPILSAQVGEKVKVRLTATLPHDLYYLAVADYIPAGTEILDTSLKTSQIGEGESDPMGSTVYDPRRPFAQGWGWWLFNNAQIYDDHISWTADFLPAGTYELTYTLVLLQPGTYRTIPARAWQLYFPDIQANSAGSVFEIKP